MQAAEDARALRPVSPRGTAVPQVPSGGPETYVNAIVNHSGRQLKQVIMGMPEAEVCLMFGQALMSNLSRGSGSPVSATGGIPESATEATASSSHQPQGQPQAAVEVAANVPEEPAAVEVAANVPEEPAAVEVAANVPWSRLAGPAEQPQYYQSDLGASSPLGDWGGIRVP